MDMDHMQIVVGTQTGVETKRFSHALDLEHPLVQFYYNPVHVLGHAGHKFTAPMGLPRGIWAELMVRLDAPANATFMMHLQNTAAREGKTVVVTSISGALGLAVKGCVETTMSMQQGRMANLATRLVWRAEGQDNSNRSPGPQQQHKRQHASTNK